MQIIVINAYTSMLNKYNSDKSLFQLKLFEINIYLRQISL